MAGLKIVVVALFSMVTLTHSYLMEVQLHESEHLNGTVFIFQRNEVDATLYDFSRVKTICYRGGWSMHGFRNFTGYTDPLVSHTMFCDNTSWRQWQSFRHFGNIDTSVDALSLYSQTMYGGSEVYVDRSPFAGIQGSIMSLSVTGSSSWTLFEGPNFDGESNCVTSPEQDYAMYGYISIQLRLSTVGSMFKGCPESLNATYVQSMRDAWTRKNQF